MEDFNVKHKGQNYNLKNFIKKHPGGINYLEKYQNKDITQKMSDCIHSKSAFYLLEEYKVPDENNIHGNPNDDLEKLVDWNKPMMHQVGKLGDRYMEWVVLPVDRELRLFKNNLIENITITPWYVVPVVWIPVVFVFLYRGIVILKRHNKNECSMLSVVWAILFGIVIWTLLEYALHRWVFHIKPSGKYKTMIYIHFVLHGLHHKVPFDARRLVFPPVPAAVIVYIFYHIYEKILPNYIMEIVAAGSLLGYVIYDMTHFYLHFGSPQDGTYFYYLKRYHNQHHFVHYDNGFGISSDIWDNIFGTIIQLRKLFIPIRWHGNKKFL